MVYLLEERKLHVEIVHISEDSIFLWVFDQNEDHV